MGANLKEVRERITSVKSTQQITKAMKMVSAAKLRKAQDAITRMRPYSNKLDGMLKNILSNLDGSASTKYGLHKPVKKAAIIVVTSNRGLCGAFNTNVIKAANAIVQEKFSEVRANKNLMIVPIGKKGYDYFSKHYKDCRIIDEYVHMFDDLSFENVSQVPERLMRGFKCDAVDAVEVAYGRFKNAATQFSEVDQFLPVPKIVVEKDGEENKQNADYIFEPDQASLLEHLIPSILKTKFLKYLLDTHASEHGARMTAMDKATENAEDMLKGLKITYNKARQEAITRELSEIVGGAAALEG